MNISDDTEDKLCDPKNPRVIELGIIREAATRIADGIVKTPLSNFPSEKDENVLYKFSVVLTDRPDEISGLVTMLSELKVSIKDMKKDADSVECSFIVETRNKEHADEMFHKLRHKYTGNCVRVPERSQLEPIVPQNTPQNSQELD